METSASAVITGHPGESQVELVRIGALGPRDVLVATTVSGVSTGTDKWVMQGRFTWADLAYPLVPGYQRSGVVEAVGAEVSTVAVGQAVFATSSADFTDVAASWGGHASRGVTPEHEIYDATGIDPVAASLAVSAQVGFNAASRIGAPAGARVVVFGDGIIGSSAALCAAARGFEVVLVGRHDERLAAVDHPRIATSNATTDDHDRIADFGPVAAVDTVQSDASFAAYVEVLPARTGQVVFSGHSPAGQTSWGDIARLQQRELTAHFVSGWTRQRLEDTLQLMRVGELPVQRLVGEAASTAAEIDTLMAHVTAGRLSPVAAVIDWLDHL